MNAERLNTIFQNYIAKFEYLNSDKVKKDPNEKYKWEIAFRFRSEMDDALSASDELFYDKLSPVLTKLADNLLQNSFELPGAALCEYVKCGETAAVKELLHLLFTADGGDLSLRQQNIDAFVFGCNELKNRHFPDSFKFEMGQRAAMVLRGLYYPEIDYIYKATEAIAFADCVEYYDSFGTYSNFKMPAYFRMCDQLVEAMRKNELLMEKHRSRYSLSDQPMHEDQHLHIFAFDMIYCAYHYYLATGIDYKSISSAERKKYMENQAKAKTLAAQLDEAEKDWSLYQEGARFFGSLYSVGMKVSHKLYGEGTILSCKDDAEGRRTVDVLFQKTNKTMTLDTAAPLISGLTRIETPNADTLAEKAALYGSVIRRGKSSVANAKEAAEKAFLPYREYLD